MTVLVAVTGFGSIWRTRFQKRTQMTRNASLEARTSTPHGVTVNTSLRQRPPAPSI